MAIVIEPRVVIFDKAMQFLFSCSRPRVDTLGCGGGDGGGDGGGGVAYTGRGT